LEHDRERLLIPQLQSAARPHGLVRPHEEKMKLEVDCYSGRKADERPVRFRLDGHEYMVEEVLDQWYGPQDVFYKVRADDGNLYILRQQTSEPDKLWDLVSFRRIVDEH
jgi:hypothetical protein